MEYKSRSKKSQIFLCNCCNYNTSKKCDYEKHILTLKHKKSENGIEMEYKSRSKKSHIFLCNFCNYTTSKKCDYEKHILTLKHKITEKSQKKSHYCNNHNNDVEINENNENTNVDNKHICDICNKIYSTQTNLWKHKQKCKYNTIENEPKKIIQNETTILTNELMLEVLKQSKELQNVLVEQNKDLQNKLLEISKTSTITTTNNTTNNHFNLNFFLNETCKDAIDLMDFVNSLQLKVEDFEETGRLGYVEGISRIILNGLKNMDIDKRPMHCTDFKRETLYIKDNNTWTKENSNKNKFIKAVKHVAQLNLNQLPKWQENNPDYVNLDTRENEEFIKLSLAALGSKSLEEEDRFMDKITKNVLKEIIIDKKI